METMTTGTNKALARRYYDTILNGRNLAAIDEFLAATFISYGPERPGR
jgi:hypothetical protein